MRRQVRCERPGLGILTRNEDDIKLITRSSSVALTIATTRTAMLHLMVDDVASGQWMRNSVVDDPQFLAATMLNILTELAARSALAMPR